MAPRTQITSREAQELNERFEGAHPRTIIKWAVEHFGRRLTLVTSFQIDGMVILDMAARLDPGIRVFTIDTGRLPQETYELMERVADRYGITVDVFYPDAPELEAFVREEGINAFYRGVTLRIRCCEIRKNAPLQRALEDADAWMSGLRRQQSTTRARTPIVQLDYEHGGIVKINPLSSWTGEDLMGYVEAENVPYHPLYHRGFTSIGCSPCTRPTRPGEHPRAGRWWWESDTTKECGIHHRVGEE